MLKKSNKEKQVQKIMVVTSPPPLKISSNGLLNPWNPGPEAGPSCSNASWPTYKLFTLPKQLFNSQKYQISEEKGETNENMLGTGYTEILEEKRGTS